MLLNLVNFLSKVSLLILYSQKKNLLFLNNREICILTDESVKLFTDSSVKFRKNEYFIIYLNR
jgi:hypothetical protein